MLSRYPTDEEIKELFPNFTLEEFNCKCGCNYGRASFTLLEMLQIARTKANIPFHINSAFRCKSYNEKIKGSSTSSHLLGFAVDIRVNDSKDRYIILTALIEAGFKRIGLAKTFIHVDIDPSKPQGVIWGYW